MILGHVFVDRSASGADGVVWCSHCGSARFYPLAYSHVRLAAEIVARFRKRHVDCRRRALSRARKAPQ